GTPEPDRTHPDRVLRRHADRPGLLPHLTPGQGLLWRDVRDQVPRPARRLNRHVPNPVHRAPPEPQPGGGPTPPPLEPAQRIPELPQARTRVRHLRREQLTWL